MYEHHPSIVVAYLPDDRALATNATADRYFVLKADGSFEHIDVASAVSLFQQRLNEEESARAEKAHQKQKIKRILASDGGDIVSRRRKLNRERARRRGRRRRQQHETQYDQRTKHIRIADKSQELEEKIRRLEAQLDAEQAEEAEQAEQAEQAEVRSNMKDKGDHS